MRFQVAILAALGLIIITGCDSGKTSTPAAAQNTTTSTPATQTVTSATTPLSTVATPAAPPLETPQQCPPQDGNQIKITIGDITCSDAYAIAAKYDVQGQKSQQIDSFTCSGGNAMTRPVIFTCVSSQAEFAVSEV